MGRSAQYGLVHGIVRFASGQPAGGCGMVPEPTTLPAAGLQEILHLSSADGSYRLALPAATYTIKAFGTSPAGNPVRGESSGIVVAGGSDVAVDITVTEEQEGAAE
jgi:hypothetical protein